MMQGCSGPQMIFDHFIHTNDDILSRVVETGSKMSWQPTSNGELGDGIADIVTYRKMGIPVAVGLDDNPAPMFPIHSEYAHRPFIP